MGQSRKSLERLLMGLLLVSPSLGAAAALIFWPGTNLGQGIFAVSKLLLVLIPLLHFIFVERPGHRSKPVFTGLFSKQRIWCRRL
jgi:hypothetical protein